MEDQEAKQKKEKEKSHHQAAAIDPAFLIVPGHKTGYG